MLVFKTLDFLFPPRSGGQQSQTKTHTFGDTIRSAVAVIGGFELAFTKEDHSLFREQVDVKSVVHDETVEVTVTLGLCDSSGKYDDLFEGKVKVLIIGDMSDGGVSDGDRIALKTQTNKYVCAQGGGGREVVADRDVAAGWETFTIQKLP